MNLRTRLVLLYMVALLALVTPSERLPEAAVTPPAPAPAELSEDEED